MSRAFGLIKFKKTGNIYYGCYNGTSDVMYPCLCTPEECRDEDGRYDSITYCAGLVENGNFDWRFPKDVSDIDKVEIYSDYGRGFWWYGTGSETAKRIAGPLAPYDEDFPIFSGKPEWVEKFFEKQLEELKRRQK